MKTKIDFYLTQTKDFINSFPFVCQLIEKIYLQGFELLTNLQSKKEAEQLDERLWTFSKTSFIPHQIQNNEQIFIGKSAQPNADALILNCVVANDPNTKMNKRLLQIIPNDPNLLQVARQHYRFYQSQGYQISTHQIK